MNFLKWEVFLAQPVEMVENGKNKPERQSNL